jgi:hypothetical protein
MSLLRIGLCVACLSLAGLRAADDKDEEKQQPEEIPNFNQLDEYTYLPKSTLSLGSRYFLTGPKTTFAGQGAIPSPVDPGSDPTIGNVARSYIDGAIGVDTRTISITTGVGELTEVPIAPDGRTNTWGYQNSSQLLPNGDMAFHTYTGEVTDTAIHSETGLPSLGLELLMDRDMGKIGKRLKWAITAGFSIADIHASSYANVPTTLTTTTDTYDLFGQVPPPGPYSSPNTISQAVLTSSGGTVSGTSSGTTSTQQANQVTLIGNVPLNRTVVNTEILTENRYFIEGAYYTLRVGPTLIMPFGQHLKLSVSAGPDLIYSGSELNVLESLTFDPNEPPITNLLQKENTKIMPGYYVSLDVRYDLNDTAGLYLGDVFQGGGGYSQSAPSGTGTAYTSRIDFGDQEGVKGGLTVRF